MDCKLLEFCTLPLDAQAGWAQVVIGLIAAIATFFAVLVALHSSRVSAATAMSIARDESEERSRLRNVQSKAMAAAFTDELWDNIARVEAGRINVELRANWEEDHLADHVASQLSNCSAPVLESCITRLDIFDPEDAKLFARAATKLIYARRRAGVLKDNISLNLHSDVVYDGSAILDSMLELLCSALQRAHQISGIAEAAESPRAHAEAFVARGNAESMRGERTDQGNDSA
ncbi:hypothetical protein [Pseudoxanthomonas sp. LARHCG66]|jgi:hypothetical protein